MYHIRSYQRPAGHLGFLACSQTVFVHLQEFLCHLQYCSLSDLVGHQLDLKGHFASVRGQEKRSYLRCLHMLRHSVSFQSFDQAQCLRLLHLMVETLLCCQSEVERPITALLQLGLRTDIHRSLQRIDLVPTQARSRVTGSAVADVEYLKIDGSGLA
jgi:hypothetical protein